MHCQFKRTAFALFTSLSLLCASQSAHADEEKAPSKSPIPWPQSSHNPVWYDYAIMGGGIGLALTWNFGIQPVDRGWSQNGFDNSFRSLFRFESPESRTTARKVSDVFYYAGFGIPILESLILMPIDYRTSLKMFAMQVENLAVLGQALILLERTTGRARPCKQEPTGCGAPDPLAGNQTAEDYKSFPSGHPSITTAGMLLSCLQHYRLGIMQNRVLDISYCALVGGMSLADGILRMNADRHYMTDTIAGWSAGVASAFLVDYLWHGSFAGYAQNRAGEETKRDAPAKVVSNVRVSPWVDGQGGGLMLNGRLIY